jgi:hypothetical protein
MSPARLKGDWTSWRDKPYAANAGSEEKRKQGERWAALNEFVRRNGGAVTSVPGNKTLRVEVGKDSSAKLTSELARLGYNVAQCGSVTRVTGAPSISPKMERLTRTVPSAFTECDVLEIRLDGR